MTDKERIQLILQDKKISNSDFCAATGLSLASLSHIISERSKPTLPVLRSIVDAYPDLNPLWVLMGQGDMYLSEGESSASATNGEPTDDTPYASDDIFSQFRNDPTVVSPSPARQQSYGVSSSPQSRNSSGAFGGQQRQNDPRPQEQSFSIDEVVERTILKMQKPARKICEVRVFYDDGTFESFS